MLSLPVFANRGKRTPNYDRDDKSQFKVQTMKIGPSAFKKDEALNIKPEEILEWGEGQFPASEHARQRMKAHSSSPQ